MKDQADTLRRLMNSRERSRVRVSDPAISVFLAPAVRKAHLFSPRALSLFARTRSVSCRIRDESDPLISSGGDPKILGRLVVLTGEDTDLLACYQSIKGWVASQSVKKLDILVCVTAEGGSAENHGRRIFAQLFQICRRFLDVELVYLGAFSRGEKMRDSLAISKYLLHYESGSNGLSNRQDAGMASS
jgi:hypothetical protein